ncbi:MAG: biopolymer transporter ExbD [Planctomycetota bacterium]|nr:biopolymer transporter ExbD [Planctomycetota bacterium]
MKMKRHHKAAPHVPFIALADIAWQIIIFFLVASSFARNDSVNVDLPTANKSTSSQQETSVTVQAGEAALMIDGKNVDMRELSEELKRKLEGRVTEQSRAVVVQFRDDISYQRNAEILYAIQSAKGIVVISEDVSK